MTIELLTQDMYKAMKEKNNEEKAVLSALISTVKNMAIDKGCKDNISESLVTDAIMKEIKTTKEQIETCPSNRTDLLNQYNTNLIILEKYAPQMMSEDDIRKVITEKYAEVLKSKNMGMIMKAVMPELKGKADGKMINKVVAEFCK